MTSQLKPCSLGRSLTWSTLRYLRSTTDIWKVITRTIYSKTGKWEREFNTTTRKDIEEFWKLRIQQQDDVRAKQPLQNGEDKYYVLSMFPYPSGQLHMGHVRVYTISDVMARYQRLLGKQVIHPMGWDAFGLPAENAAIERGEIPDKWTNRNIENMRRQLKDLCCSFDWDREYSTSDPKYYRWTQFFFLKLYEAGLVYQKEALVNWDPVDQTVLADEQIDSEGHSWRSGAKVEKLSLRQWYIRITAYSKHLSEGLQKVDHIFWKEVAKQQKNWIGRCTGCRFDFKVKDGDEILEDSLHVYTNFPEAVYGASHIMLSHQHLLNKPEMYQNAEDGSNEDILLRLKAVHPLTGVDIPIIISSSLVTDEFNTNNDNCIGIPCTSDVDKSLAEKFGFPFSDVYTDDGDTKTIMNSGKFSGLNSEAAKEAITQFTKENKCGGYMCSPNHKDWLISRQRYWGTPIPMVHCPKCKAVPVPYDDLPVVLPKVESLAGKNTSPLKQNKEWLNTNCPKCGGPATRETDTMDTFVDSSWYFLRYLDPHSDKRPFDKELADKFMPVDLYIGGLEHAIMHMYYARFFNYFLCDTGFLKHKEPFDKLLTQGLVMGQSFSLKDSGKYIRKEEVDFSGEKPVEKSTGAPVIVQWEKMSKSKYNGVDPQDVLDEFGVDTTRLCIIHNVPPKTDRNWSHSQFAGVINWQYRIWNLVTDFIEQKSKSEVEHVDVSEVEKWDEKILEFRNFLVLQISQQMNERFFLSVAIARLQTLTSELKKVPLNIMPHSKHLESVLADLVVMLSPFAPNFSEELWSGLGSITTKESSHKWDKSVLQQVWPTVADDFNVIPMEVKINYEKLFKVKLSAIEFEKLTKNRAVDIVKEHDKYKEVIEPEEVTRIHLNYSRTTKRAFLHFTIPSLDKKLQEEVES